MSMFTKISINNLFAKKPLTVSEFISTTQNSICVVLNAKDAKDDTQIQKENTAIAKCLGEVKKSLKSKESGEEALAIAQELSVHMAKSGLMKQMVRCISNLYFEARKDVAFLFRYLLQRSSNIEHGFTVSYILNNFDIVRELMNGYRAADSSSACCGLMLRECARHEELAKRLLEDPCFEYMFEYVQLTQFDIASDAFSTLRELLVHHKAMVAKFLEEKFDSFFAKYSKLLESDNYVTKRQALRMLLDVLLDRNNIRVMTKYINQPGNLKLMMNLLRDQRRAIKKDALHMFKVFVCNPNKEKEVRKILVKNQSKLHQFIIKMEADEQDELFLEDRELVLAAISNLEVGDAEPSTPKRIEECNGH
mmetsp:Transcript_41505/g.84853  ORF Transcript_41505/g.84853 Transcript_41505/m.84853 type:complete len:364 (+) Transcript_41505:419-1510(+)|eukprot:CAMPEP_0181299680 /NCGR_PEP_ID=MMETSP1101-20121128/6479_1 /TAXON_ID=46948 /ORGANISM="Rhodomonas abbreviata, Strain Caron Lab Isolate" /LENGTH=363 /DNA_ID=CAMNT_0023404853 /DNA_START=419 /DNA_END=1510 /DNA_ORIENTATION=+